MSCNVCVEAFNKSTRLEVSCDFCEFKACRKCCETYLLQTQELPHCMNCKKEWSRKMLVDKFTQKFINNDYKKHQEQILFEKEQALLPATQPIIEQLKEKEKITNIIFGLRDQIADLFTQLKHYESLLKKDVVIESKNFVRKCSNNGCKGFLSTQWKCGLCEMWSCSDCYEVKGPNKDTPHACTPANLETAKLLAKDTKPCPKCGTLIFKSEGCQQMWCTQCHTTFDWKTGRLETGTIHNPHYIQWLRKNGQLERNPLDIQCGREIDARFINYVNNQSKNRNKVVLDLLRQIIHLRFVEVQRFTTNHIQDNQDLRIAYMTNQINTEAFKQALQKRNKSFYKKREISNILGMFITSATDIFYRYADNIKQCKSFNDSTYYAELQNLRIYVNDCLKDVSKVFNCKCYNLSPTLIFT